MNSPMTVRIDAQLRGRATPATLRRLELIGMHVHRIGQAAYVHDDAGQRWILGVWNRRTPPPPWDAELRAHHRWLIGRGEPTALRRRRSDAYLARRRLIPGALLNWWAEYDADGRMITPRERQPWRLS